MNLKLFNQLVFASALSVASILNLASASAHEIKIGNLLIEHPWARQSPMKADVAAGFMVITNEGLEDDRLLKVTADISGNVQLHDMKMEGDVMKMVELPDGILIPAGGTVTLKPRSLHVMFMEVKSQPMEGEVFDGTLTFEKAGAVKVDFEVMAPNAGMN